jgi:protein-L-isoaspartate O-methyltransferase
LLLARGEINQRWAEVMQAVPRHRYIPDTIYRHQRDRPGNDLVPLHRHEQPDEWLHLVYSDESVNTQVDGGRPDADGTGFEVTSSSSQPSVVAGMLDELAARPSDRVLEVGTGTGWNAALLAEVVAAGNVTTVEVDPVIAARARASLDGCGYGAVTVITGDGAVGYWAGAPYARVIVTVGMSAVPYSLVEQAGPGGRIVAPLTGSFQPPGVVTLVCHADGTASGRLAGPAAFMALRGTQPRVRAVISDVDVVESVTKLHPYRYAGDRDAATAVGLRLGGVYRVWRDGDDHPGTLSLYAPASSSRASVRVQTEPPHLVTQAGPRRLFDEVEEAYRWWQEAGEPTVGDWLVTVGPSGQEIILKPA